MKACHLLGGQSAILVSVSRIESGQTLCAHTVMLGLELGPTHHPIAIGVQGLEAPFLKAFGGDSRVRAMMRIAWARMAMLTLRAVMTVMPCGAGRDRCRRRAAGG